MKNLNKSLFLGLVAVITVATTLVSCEKESFNDSNNQKVEENFRRGQDDEFVIMGIVKDANSLDPITNAELVIFSVSTGEDVQTSGTNNKGEFTVNLVAGNYKAKVYQGGTYMGDTSEFSVTQNDTVSIVL